MKRQHFVMGLVIFISLFSPAYSQEIKTSLLMNSTMDVSKDFADFTNQFFFADKLVSFDGMKSQGLLLWKRKSLYARQAFNKTTVLPQDLKMLDFPDTQYENDPQFKFSVDFVSAHTIRIRLISSSVEPKDVQSLMLVGQPPKSNAWVYSKTASGYQYKSNAGTLIIESDPWRILLYNSKGKLLTSTRRWLDDDSTQVNVLPFNFIKRGNDNARLLNPVFSLQPGEKIVGCGESFTSLNKVGQKLNLFVTDPQGPETKDMYKPIPFFISSRGYGMFMHTSAPVTCDFGATYTGATKLFMADDALDLFLFVGTPKEILDEYTNLTGKSPIPPLWSFGTWMSRISYFSEKEGYEVAANLRKYKIPADVIHFDTGWFETDWQCDYKFAPSRFNNPQKMINDLLKDGFHISLWQLTYFTPKNKYFKELVDSGYVVKNANGGLPYEDAVIDFSNPKALTWYQRHIAGLLSMGVGAIKGDFGEAAPLNGMYYSGKGGLYEHNLYPLRYNKALADITKQVKGDNIIWARSAWAGSQRYPLHWGGDAANTNMGMLSTLRGGLSFGLSGFAFWSHDIGGFVKTCPEELYRRWLPFGFLTSHSRSHGAPPKEPWLYNESFVKAYRLCAEMKHKLMPYIYAQAKDCSERGLPMLRALCIEYPDDPSVWQIEDQYLFGEDILVAPLFESGNEREVYLPGGKWIDYQNGMVYPEGWNKIKVGVIPAVILIKDGSVIPHIGLAQSTLKMDWSKLTLNVYSTGEMEKLVGKICLQSDKQLKECTLNRSGDSYKLDVNPLSGKSELKIRIIK